MYTYHDDNDVFKKISFSLSKISKHKSLFRNDNNTTKKKDKKKGKRAYKRVTFVMVFCGINTNIMYEPSCNKESQ